MKHLKNCILLLNFLIILLAGCQSHHIPCILISRANGTIFQDWLSKADNDLNFINMYKVSQDSIEYFLTHSSGMIISGGPDVNPALYGKEDEIGKCEDIDYRRDTLEIRMIRHAMANKIPLLGICRGLQILNVANQGTLIPDIPADYDTIIKHREKPNVHRINLIKGTMLYRICQTTGDTVNSFHHQAVNDIAASFRAVAFAEDGLVEAIELADTTVHPFILGVQWHPERMEYSNPLAGPVAEEFIREVRKIHQQD